MTEQKILFDLLTNGYSYITDILVTQLNKKLRLLNYEAVMWSDKSILILRDLENGDEIFYPWKNATISEAKNIIEKLIYREDKGFKFNKESTALLLNEKWIEKTNDGYELGKRFLVQYDDYLILLDCGYNRCKYCSIVLYDAEYHEHCHEHYINEVCKQRK